MRSDIHRNYFESADADLKSFRTSQACSEDRKVMRPPDASRVNGLRYAVWFDDCFEVSTVVSCERCRYASPV